MDDDEKKSNFLFTSEEKSDFRVMTNDGGTFYVSKTILSQCSPVFEKMFSIGMKESSTGELVMEDKTSVEMEQFFRILYPPHNILEEVTHENVSSLLRLSSEYQVDPVLKKCDGFLCTQETTIELLNTSSRYGLPNLKTKCCKDIGYRIEDFIVKVNDIEDKKLLFDILQHSARKINNLLKVHEEVREEIRSRYGILSDVKGDVKQSFLDFMDKKMEFMREKKDKF